MTHTIHLGVTTFRKPNFLLPIPNSQLNNCCQTKNMHQTSIDYQVEMESGNWTMTCQSYIIVLRDGRRLKTSTLFVTINSNCTVMWFWWATKFKIHGFPTKDPNHRLLLTGQTFAAADMIVKLLSRRDNMIHYKSRGLVLKWTCQLCQASCYLPQPFLGGGCGGFIPQTDLLYAI